jgi:hypothetical protein
MARETVQTRGDDRIGEVLSGVEIPLENVAFAVEQYLLSHGQRLDAETRVLLAGVRDCVGRVVVSARQLSRHEAAGRRVGKAA